MIKNKKDNKILKRVLSLCLVLMLAVTSVHLFFPVGAETIDHTHIWATKYDSTNHWEYCTVCGDKRNVTAHVYTDHWAFGYESCRSDNYSRRICSCGYSYIYRKPHSTTRLSSHTYWERIHSNECTSCGDWLGVESCKNENGVIDCKNPGKCITCGGTWSDGRHYIVNGQCATCKKVFYTVSDKTVSYSSDYSHVYVKFLVHPADSSVVPVDTQTNGHAYTNGGMSHHGTIVKNSDGTYTVTLDVIITSAKGTATVGWIYNNVSVNGVVCFTQDDSVTVWKDHVSPVQNDVIQEDQASANGWATIKQLTLSGTENMSDIVYLTVSDKITGEKYVTDAAVSVTDGKYSYTCTPPIEADANGRTYVVTAKDRIGNVSTKEFVVYKTDGSAPALKAGTSLSYTDWTHTPKNISLSFYDFGAGGVQVSFDNQTSYQALTKNGEYYIWNKSFGNQVGMTEHKLYVKDALGNATVYTLTVGNVDTNAYTITYNLDGGTISGQKTTYTVEDTFTLPQPTKTGYTFTGWTGSNGTIPQKSVTVNKGTKANLSYTANWQINTYQNQISHWLRGFKNAEGNNGNGDAFCLGETYFSAAYKSNFVMDASRATKMPNGCYVKSSDSALFWKDGVHWSSGIYGTITQEAYNMRFQYGYRPYDYKITYNLDGGTNNSANPSTYTVLYGVTLKEPTKNGYKFAGWFDENGNKITGINEGCNATFSSTDDLYTKLAIRTIGDRTLTARWTPITWTVKYDANGGIGTMSDSNHVYDGGTHFSKNAFSKTGYSFDGWTLSRVVNGKTQWAYGDSNGNWIGPTSWYELGKNPAGTKLYKTYEDGQICQCDTYIDGDVQTAHAQWQINTYDLFVKHTVSGNMGNKHSDFSFTMNLSGMSGNNITAVFTDASGKQTTKTLSMNNGKVAFTLKHGESIVFKDVPYNTSYTITENNADGYTVSNSNASGKVTANTTVTFTSTRNVTVPTSADTNAKAMVAIAGLSIIAMTLILKRRKTKTE